MAGVINTLNEVGKQISETGKQAGSTASKETNEQIAKGHTDASLTTRATAAKDGTVDKFNEEKHKHNANVAGAKQ